MNYFSIRYFYFCLLFFGSMHTALAQQSCDALMDISLPYTTITSAKHIPEGAIPAPELFGEAPPMIAPAHCEVQATTRPSSNSEIKLELWLPVSDWNGKYLQVGNGGWAGSINRTAFITPLQRGYAVAGTDNGHSAEDPGAVWAIGHPEKLIDFGYRAVHETSVQAKAILNAYYGRPQELSFFNGCSDGGREALMEAQRYPEDFNGIIAGAPANNWSHLFTGFVWNQVALAENPLTPEKLPIIQSAVLAACDDLDGVKDGLIENPSQCTFDPEVLICEAGDGGNCLSQGQISTLEMIYNGATNPATGESIYPGWPMGTEAVQGGWVPWIVSPAPQALSIQANFGNTYYGHAVFEQQEWDYSSLDFDKDVEFGNNKAGAILNSNSPDLRSFRANGGKLIQYHGWGDAAISAFSSIEYYERVNSFLNSFPDPRSESNNIDEFYRLFMVPGMGHCSGGIGPNNFGNGLSSSVIDANHDLLEALDAWVVQGIAPTHMIGTGTVVDDTNIPLTRPICPYPQTAQYLGGDQNSADNFVCALPLDSE